MSIGGDRGGFRVLALALTLGVAASPARAQSEEDGVVALDQIDVVGAAAAGWQGASDDIYATPAAVAQVGRAEIDARGGARNAGDLLRGASGVNAVTDRQTPAVNVNIRGLQDQGRVNMTIDGARQNFQQAGHGATGSAFIDPELIGGIEIDKGPSSTAGGAGVIGGVVDFRTLDFSDVASGEKDYGVRFNGVTGTNAFDFNGSLAAAARLGEGFEAVAAVGRKKLGEYRIGKRGKLEEVDPSNPLAGKSARFTTQDQWSWLAKGTARPNDRDTFKLTWTGLSTKFGTGSGEAIDKDDVVNNTFVADWRHVSENPLVDLAAKAYYTRTANDQFRPARARLSAASVDYAIDTYGGSIANTSRFSVPLFEVALTYGGEIFLDKSDTASVFANPTDDPSNSQFSGSNPIGERGVGGLFARAELKHSDWLTILAGLRYDRYALDGSGVLLDGAAPGCVRPRDCPTPFKVDMKGGRFSPTATVAVTPWAGVQIYGSYEQGWRPPNLMESVLGGEHVGGGLSSPFSPNPNLKPEVSRTLEAGVNVKLDGVLTEGEALRAKASIYSTKVDDFITQALVFRPSGDGFFYQNVNLKDRTRLEGVDLEAAYDLGHAYLGGSASFLRSRYGASYDGKPPFDDTLSGIYLAPKAKLALDGGVRFFDRALTIGGRVTHVKPETNIAPLGAVYKYRRYTLLDAYASYKINDQITLRASVENLTDVAYVEAMGSSLSPSPGRTFTIGATARF